MEDEEEREEGGGGGEGKGRVEGKEGLGVTEEEQRILEMYREPVNILRFFCMLLTINL